MSEERIMANGSGRRRDPAPERSHEDIYAQGEEANRKADDAVHRTDLLMAVVQRVEGKLDALTVEVKRDLAEMKHVVGEEIEPAANGERMGTGLVGFMLRLDLRMTKRLGIYDNWTRLAMGGVIVAGVLIPAFWAVVWWLTSTKLEHVLK